MTNKPKSRDEIVKQIQRKHLILTPKGEEIQIDLTKTGAPQWLDEDDDSN